MRAIGSLPLLLLLGCTSSTALLPGTDGGTSSPGDDGGVGGGGPSTPPSDPNASTVSFGDGSQLMRFAVFGDVRPANKNQTAAYPTQIITSLFQLMQQKNAQFAIGTGDYMFASTASAVDAQLGILLQAESGFAGTVFHALGNHECNGFTAGNCPALNESPNIQAFMQRLAPHGLTTAYYRVDVPTPMGKAKFLYIAANAWSDAQGAWLKQQLADPTTYTFLVRHEAPTVTDAPGVSPSEMVVLGHPFTMELLGHSHEFSRLDTKHLISGNAGAPLANMGNGTNYGFVLVEQQADGVLQLSEIDEATGNVTEAWKVTPAGDPTS
jgi:hypothetical protein